MTATPNNSSSPLLLFPVNRLDPSNLVPSASSATMTNVSGTNTTDTFGSLLNNNNNNKNTNNNNNSINLTSPTSILKKTTSSPTFTVPSSPVNNYANANAKASKRARALSMNNNNNNNTNLSGGSGAFDDSGIEGLVDGDDDLLFSDDYLIRMAILSRVVERYRFLIPSERIDDEVDEEALLWMFELDAPIQHQKQKNKPPASEGTSNHTLSRKSSALSSLFDKSTSTNRGGNSCMSPENTNNNNNMMATTTTSSAVPAAVVVPAVVDSKRRGKGWARLAARVSLGDFARQVENATKRENLQDQEMQSKTDDGHGSSNKKKRVVKTFLDAHDNLVRIEISESDEDNDDDAGMDDDGTNSKNGDAPPLAASSSSQSSSFQKPPKSPALKSPTGPKPTTISSVTSSKWKNLNLKNLPLVGSLAFKLQQEQQRLKEQQQREQQPRKRVHFADVVRAVIEEHNISYKKLNDTSQKKILKTAADSSSSDSDDDDDMQSSISVQPSRMALKNQQSNAAATTKAEAPSAASEPPKSFGLLLKQALLDQAREDEKQLAIQKRIEANENQEILGQNAKNKWKRLRLQTQVANRFSKTTRKGRVVKQSPNGDGDDDVDSIVANVAGSNTKKFSLRINSNINNNNNLSATLLGEGETDPQHDDDENQQQQDLRIDDSKTSLASAASRFAVAKVSKAVSAISALTLGVVKTASTNVRDSVKDTFSDVINVASDLGFVKKKEHDTELSELAATLWRFVSFTGGDEINGRGIHIRATFRELLEFDLENFPYTTFKQREILRSFEEKGMVSRQEIAMELAVEFDDPILQCLFGSFKELPGIVYDRLVSCLHEHPHKHSFAQVCAQNIETAKTNMSLVFTTVIMFLVTLIVVPQLNITPMYLLQFLSFDSTTGEFPNRCSDGNVTDPSSCFFIQQTMLDVSTTDGILPFFREFIARELWNEDDVTRGSEDTLFGNVRVGGVLMKTSPRVDSPYRERINDPNSPCPLRPCSALNLSQEIFEFKVSSSFSCDAFDRENSIIVIPFNLSRPEALEVASKFTPWYCGDDDVMVTMQYALYQPSQQILSWTTVSFTVPRAGAVVPRSYTGTMNLNAKGLIRAFAGIHLSIFFWLLLIVITRRREGFRRFFTAQMLSEYVLSVMNIISLALIESLPNLDEILQLIVQADYVPEKIDGYIKTYNDALDLIGWWTLIFYIGACSIFSDVIGLNVITRLLKVTAADVAVLLVLFTVISSGFLGVARVLFGTANPVFSFSLTTTTELLRFLWGSADFEVITKQAPVAGAVFFFAFLTFVFVIALNILISVITSRLEDLRSRANLHLELYQKIQRDASNFEGNERFWFDWKIALLPLINLVVDAAPFISSTLRWKEFNRYATELFNPYLRRELPRIHDLVENAKNLLQFMDKASPANFLDDREFWNTALRRSIDTYEPMADRISWALLERVILLQSKSDSIRDAALVRVLICYDETATDIDKVIEHQEEQINLCLEDRERLAEGVSLRHKKFAENDADKKKQQQQKYDQSKQNQQSNNNNFQPSLPSSPLNNTASPLMAQTFLNSSSNDAFGGSQPSMFFQSPLLMNGQSGSNDPSSFPGKDLSAGNFSTTTSASDFAKEIFASSAPNSKSDLKKLRKMRTGFNVSAARQTFWINQYILRQVKGFLYFPLRSILSLALYLAFFFSLLLYNESATWLGVNVGEGLTNYPYDQQCYDANCTLAFTFDKRFKDIGNLEDIQEYIRKLLAPKLFPEEAVINKMYPTMNRTRQLERNDVFPVLWDENIRRIGPVTVRQVRARKETCALPSAQSLQNYNDEQRKALFKNLECYSSGQNDNTPMIRPTDSQLAEEAYQFRDDCIENTLILGSFDLYPCSGYSAKVHNRSQMLYIQNWLDMSAKLVVFSATFASKSEVLRSVSSADSGATTSEILARTSGKNVDVRIDIYIELSPGGGATVQFQYLTVAEQPMFKAYAWLGFTNLGIDLSFFLFHVARFAYYVIKRRKLNSKSAQQHKPDVPWINIFTLIACIWLASIDSIQQQLRETWMLSVLVISSTAMLMNNFIYPITKIVTFRALTLIRSLNLAVRLVLVIVPFYLVTSIGFVVCGHLIFGRNAAEYSTIRFALQAIGRGLLTDWNIDNIYEQRPLPTIFFTIAFFAVILVVLSNLLLTLISAAVDEAKRETAIVSFVQMAAEFSNKRVFCDESVATFLAWHLAEHHILRKSFRKLKIFWTEKIAKRFFFTKESQRELQQKRLLESPLASETEVVDPVTGEVIISSEALIEFKKEVEAVTKRNERAGQFFVSQSGRFSRPLESLMYVCSPFRLQELAESLHLTEVSEDFIYSVALFLARSQQDFIKKFPDQFTLDDAVGARLMSGFREACAATTIGDSVSVVGGGDDQQNNTSVQNTPQTLHLTIDPLILSGRKVDVDDDGRQTLPPSSPPHHGGVFPQSPKSPESTIDDTTSTFVSLLKKARLEQKKKAVPVSKDLLDDI